MGIAFYHVRYLAKCCPSKLESAIERKNFLPGEKMGGGGGDGEGGGVRLSLKS